MGQIRGRQQTKLRTDAEFGTVECLKLRVVHKLTIPQIAQHFGVTPQAVWQRLKRFQALLRDPDAAAAFREREADLLDGMRMQLLEQLANTLASPAGQRTSARDLGVVYGILFDKTRLSRGHSTVNVGLRTSIILEAWGRGSKPHQEQHQIPPKPATS